MVKHWFGFLAVALVACKCFAESSSHFSLDLLTGSDAQAPLQVGDLLELKLHAQAGDSTFILRAPKDASFRILNAQGETTLKPDPQQFYFVPLKPGAIQIPSLEVLDAQGNLRGRTDAISVQVSAPKPDETPKSDDAEKGKPPEILPPVELQWSRELILSIAISAGLILFLLMWGMIRRFRMAKPKALVGTEALNEYQTLVRSLESLSVSATWRQGKYKTHYFAVSNALKLFLSERFNCDANESTTGEVLKLLQNQAIEVPLLQRLSRLFEILDRVKFTDYQPETDESQAILKETLEIGSILRRPGTDEVR